MAYLYSKVNDSNFIKRTNYNLLKIDEMKDRLNEINPDTLIKVLIEQNNLILLNEWIKFSYSVTNDSIFKTKLNQKMIDKIYESKCFMPDYKDLILNNLAT